MDFLMYFFAKPLPPFTVTMTVCSLTELVLARYCIDRIVTVVMDTNAYTQPN